MKTSFQLEIETAIWQAQRQPKQTILRPICIICKDYLNRWDVKAKKGVCWKCSKTFWPKSQVEEKSEEPKRPRLVQLRDGLYAFAVD